MLSSQWGYSQLEPFPGFVIHSADSTASLRISPRLRIMYTGIAEDNQNFESNISTPLARIGLIGQAFGKWRFFIQTIFAPQEIQTIGNELEGIGAKAMLDGRIEYLINQKTRISFGQEFLPGNWEGLNGLINTTFTNRSIVSRAFWLSRDIGIQLKHYGAINRLPIRIYLSVSKGEGRNVLVSNEGGWLFTGRISLAILGQPEGAYTYMYSDISRDLNHRLWISTSFSHNRNASRQNGNTGKSLGIYSHINKWFADLSYKYHGLGFLYGFALQNSSELESDFNIGNGHVVQASYLFNDGIEVAMQFASINNRKESPLIPRDQWSLGLNKYFRNQSLKWVNEVNIQSNFESASIKSMLQLIL